MTLLTLLECSQVSNVAWSFAIREIQDVKLFNTLAFRACQIMQEEQACKPQDISMLVRASCMKTVIVELFTCTPYIKNSKSMHACILPALFKESMVSSKVPCSQVWAFARQGLHQTVMLKKCAEEALQNIDK